MSSFIAAIRALNVGTKLALLAPLIMSLVFAVPAWLISAATAELIEEQTIAEIAAKIRGLLDVIDASVDGFKTEADYALKLLEHQFPDGFTLDPTATVQISGRATPALNSGNQTLNLNFAVVDAFTQDTGNHVATLFVRQEDDFIRIATSLKKENGERAIGTLLDHAHPAWRRLLNNQSYHGAAT